MITKILKNRILLTIILSSIIVCILFIFSPFFHVLNKNIQNGYYGLKNSISWLKVSNNIVVVTIDKKTLDTLGRFPFSRDVYVDFLKNLHKKEVATVAFDILFIDETSEENDRKFASAIDMFDYVVLGASIMSNNDLELPLEKLNTASFGVGFLPPNVDVSNRTVYSFSPFLLFGDTAYEHFAVTALRSFYSYLYQEDFRTYPSGIAQSVYEFSENIAFPLSRKNENDILIHFIDSDNFQKISFVDVLDEKSLREIELQDKIILVGATADGIKDEFFTPNGLEYGVYAHANILNTLLTKNYLVYFEKKLEWVLVFLLIIIGTYFNLSRRRGVLIVSNIILITAFLVIMPLAVFFFTNLIINFPIEIIFALILSLTLSNGIKYFIEDGNKKKLKKSLSEYVGSHIADEILEEAGKVNFDGEEKKAILFFSDIEGFTTISEDLQAKELVAFLREYLSEMSHIILDEKGYINKYEWDAIMAIWWAFSELNSTNYRQVCHASLLQMELLNSLNENWRGHYGKDIRIRIGIHAGDVIVWNNWATGRKMEFTALWDTVNLASRLEGVNKFYGTHICASDAVYEETKDEFVYRFLDKIRVKWKRKPLKIYELIGRKGEVSEDKMKELEQFAQALEYYFQKDFLQAKLLFQELAEKGDGPSLAFKSRITIYEMTPPQETWDGVWSMEEK